MLNNHKGQNNRKKTPNNYKKKQNNYQDTQCNHKETHLKSACFVTMDWKVFYISEPTFQDLSVHVNYVE